ncbi:reticulon-like protein B13 isoform X1 [Coffea arabica]|uniref:Reticulon-like protein n=1 Tax=Coffea arabica TaxID=13443 RepID=A0ABM4V587_COFAR
MSDDDDTGSETSPPPTVAVGVETLRLQRKQPAAAAVAALVVRDVLLWRRIHVSILVLVVATATWVALQLYQYNAVQVGSWAAMFLFTLIFVWGNIHRLLKIEGPDVSGMEISERRAAEMAHGIREWIEEGIRWLFRVGAEREWSVFGATVAALGLLSWIATRFDLLTLVYMEEEDMKFVFVMGYYAGVVLGMTVPAIYVKHENKIIEYGMRSRIQSKKYYDLSKGVLRRIRSKVAAGKKHKKIE